jgi:hypothetical protein
MLSIGSWGSRWVSGEMLLADRWIGGFRCLEWKPIKPRRFLPFFSQFKSLLEMWVNLVQTRVRNLAFCRCNIEKIKIVHQKWHIGFRRFEGAFLGHCIETDSEVMHRFSEKETARTLGMMSVTGSELDEWPTSQVQRSTNKGKANQFLWVCDTSPWKAWRLSNFDN